MIRNVILIGSGSLLVLRQIFVVVPFDQHSFHAWQIGRKVQSFFGFLITLLLVSQLCLSSGQREDKCYQWLFPVLLRQSRSWPVVQFPIYVSLHRCRLQEGLSFVVNRPTAL